MEDSLRLDPELKLFEDHGSYLRFRPGRSFGGPRPLLDEARRTGRPAYYVESGRKVVELVPREARMPDVECRALQTTVEHFSLGGILGDLLKNVIGSRSLPDLKRGLDTLTPEEAVDFSEAVMEFEWEGLMREVDPGDRKRVSEFLWRLDRMALKRLGRELKTSKLEDDVVKGLVVREGFDMALESLELDEEMMGGSRAEVAGITPKTRQHIEMSYTERMGQFSYVRGREPVGMRECMVMRDNAGALAGYYAARWNHLNGEWLDSDASLQFLKAFDEIKDYIVFQPWNPLVEKTYAQVTAVTGVTERTQEALRRVALELNTRLNMGQSDDMIVGKLRQPLARLEDSVFEDLPYVDGGWRGEDPVDDLVAGEDSWMRENTARIANALDTMAVEPDHVKNLVRLARAWRTEP